MPTTRTAALALAVLGTTSLLPGCTQTKTEKAPAAPAARILSFTATPAAVDPGAPVTLAWTTADASRCLLFPAGATAAVPAGSAVVTPTTATTYALFCDGAGGSDVASAAVGVNVAILAFAATPSRIYTGGDAAALRWRTLNAAACDLGPGVGALAPAELAEGARTVSPSFDTTYALTCAGASGTASASATVQVQRVWFVGAPPGEGAATGTSWADAAGGFADPDLAVTTGDEVWVRATRFAAPGTSTPVLQAVGGATYRGGFNGTETRPEHRLQPIVHTVLEPFRDAKGTVGRVIAAAPDGTAATPTRLDGFALAGARPALGGQAALTVGGATVLSSCVFADNVAPATVDGGAIAASGGPLTIEGCTFTGNQARLGGAIFANAAVELDVRDSTFVANVGTISGAAIHAVGRLTVRDSDFLQNAGGTAKDPSVLAGRAAGSLVANSLFDGNAGGAIVVDTQAVVGSTFVRNTPLFRPATLASGANDVFWGNGAAVQPAAGLSSSCIEGCTTCVGTTNFPLIGANQVTASGMLSYAGVAGATATSFCVDRGDGALSDAAGIPWRQLSSRDDGAKDAPPLDPGVHR